jgi:HSP20 family protein
MAITRWRRGGLIDPVDEMDQLQREINRLFDFDNDESVRGLFDRSVAPAMDVEETADEFWVTCDLPGVERSDIDVSIANNILTVKGHKKAYREKDEGRVYRNETWSGDFQRTLSLPNAADPDKISAELKNGVLTIRLPKREEVKPKQISVNVK